ncbi:MAG: bifunctional UDP-sugar hydrolase/5'-nucleotidase [Smithellaceae bacterium]|jgi:2',3'-cyclic-nucleotide 2'-phosphodiesterase (5'-nucleotidase family)
MKLAKKIMLLTFSLLLIIIAGGDSDGQERGSRELVILFTHDLHSYLLPHKVLTQDGQQVQQGGYAKLAYVIKEQRTYQQNKTLRVDAGDFSMGTLFHTSFLKEASELRLMGKMGYDVATFGNHDFDFHAEGLAKMLQTARSKSQQLPALVASNIIFSRNDPGDAALKQAFKDYPVKDYMVFERNGIRIGVFGIMGKDAGDDTTFIQPVKFGDPIRASKKMVDVLKDKEKVDVVICLSPSDTSPVKNKSEDQELARKVPQIDVIISGHTYTILPKPIKVGRTIIVSSGCYGEYLGILKVFYTKGKDIKVASYALRNITTGIPDDRIVSEEVADYKDIVSRDFLSPYRLSFDQVIAESDFNMDSLASAYANPREMGLGNMITDAYRYAVQKAEGNNYEYVHVAVEPLGLIRDSFQKGKITTADVFQVLSLGIGRDGVAGYPLLAFYVNGKELKDILEVEASVAPFKKEDAHLQVSGVKFAFNPHRILFDRVTQVSVQDEKGEYKTLDFKKLYRVCSNLYAAEMINYVSKVTYGLLSVKPKDKKGRALPDLNKAIIYTDKGSSKPQELKEWIALTQYMRSFTDTNRNGIPNIPGKYRAPEGRYQAEPSTDLKKILANGNFITYGALIIGIVFLCALIFLIVLVIKKVRPLLVKVK